jgi:hypothetical protein
LQGPTISPVNTKVAGKRPYSEVEVVRCEVEDHVLEPGCRCWENRAATLDSKLGKLGGRLVGTRDEEESEIEELNAEKRDEVGFVWRTHPNRGLIVRIVIECNVTCLTRHDTEQVSLIEVPITWVGRATNRAISSTRVLRAGVVVEVG